MHPPLLASPQGGGGQRRGRCAGSEAASAGGCCQGRRRAAQAAGHGQAGGREASQGALCALAASFWHSSLVLWVCSHSASVADIAATPQAAAPAGVHFTEQPVDGLLGRRLKRYWPEEGGWFEAVITNFDPVKGEHCMMYDMGTPNETYAWERLASIPKDEIVWIQGPQVPLHQIVEPLPPAPVPAPAVRPPVGGAARGGAPGRKAQTAGMPPVARDLENAVQRAKDVSKLDEVQVQVEARMRCVPPRPWGLLSPRPDNLPACASLLTGSCSRSSRRWRSRAQQWPRNSSGCSRRRRSSSSSSSWRRTRLWLRWRGPRQRGMSTRPASPGRTPDWQFGGRG